MDDVLQHAPGPHVGVGGRPGVGPHLRHRQPGGVEGGGDLGHGLRRRPLRHQCVDGVAGRQPARDGGEDGVVGQVGAADDPGQDRPVRVEEHPEEDAAVLGVVDVGGSGEAELVAQPGIVHAHGPDGEEPVRLEEERVEQGHVEVLAFAGAGAVVERTEDGDGTVEAGEVVGQEDRRPHRRPVGVAVQRHEPAGRLGQRVVAALVVLRAVLPEAADRGVDDVGLHRPDGGVAHAPLVHGPGAEVLHDDVAAPGEVEEHLPALVGPQVEAEAALVAVDVGVGERQRRVRPRQQRRQAADDLTAGQLDLDDVGAQIGEDAAAHRAGQRGGRLHHPDPGQRPGDRCRRRLEEVRLVHAAPLSPERRFRARRPVTR